MLPLLFLLLTILIHKHIYKPDLISSYLGTSPQSINHTIDTLNVRIIHLHDKRDFRTVFDVDRHRNLAIGWLFAVSVGTAILLAVLMLCEIADTFDGGMRLTLFSVCIGLLVPILCGVVPWLTVSLMVSHDLVPRDRVQATKSAALFIAWLLILHKCGELSSGFAEGRSWVQAKVNEIGVVGITVLAVLSGVGCITTSYTAFQALRSRDTQRNVSEYELNALVRTYNSACEKIEQDDGDVTETESFPSLLHKVRSFASLQSLPEQTLHKTKTQTYSEIVSAVERLKQAQQPSGPMERAARYANMAFACYCVYRIVVVLLYRIPSLVLAENGIRISSAVITDHEPVQTPHRDALATTLAKILLAVFYNWGVSEQQLTNQLSFVLSGSLFVGSMSSVVATFRSFAEIMPDNTRHDKNVTRWLKHLFVAELVGVYTVATALLIRSNLPAALSRQISAILSLGKGTVKELDFIDGWFDVVFGGSCVVTGVVILRRRREEVDEEMMLA